VFNFIPEVSQTLLIDKKQMFGLQGVRGGAMTIGHLRVPIKLRGDPLGGIDKDLGEGPTMEFKALNVPALNEETAAKLDALFSTLSGIEQYTITVDTGELDIVFDENQLSFRALISEMTEAGCPLNHIDAALLL